MAAVTENRKQKFKPFVILLSIIVSLVYANVIIWNLHSMNKIIIRLALPSTVFGKGGKQTTKQGNVSNKHGKKTTKERMHDIYLEVM